MGTYMIETLGFSGTEVGLIYANNAIAATISPTLIGLLADRYMSAEKLLSLLHLCGGALLFFHTQVDSFAAVFLLNLLNVLCYMPTFSLTNSLCFHHIDDAKRDFAPIRVWGTVGWVVAGVLISALAIESEATTFLIASGASFLLCGYAFSLPKTPPIVQSGVSLWQSLRSPEMKQLLAGSEIRAIVICVALISFPAAYYYTFVNPFLTDMQVAHTAAKMSIGQVAEIVLMLTLPWFIAKYSLRSLMFVGLFLWGARYGLFMLGIHWDVEWVYWLALVAHGPAYVFGMLVAQIYLDIKMPDSLRSTTQGFFTFLTMGIVAYLGTYIAGETVDVYTDSAGSKDWFMIWLVPMVVGVLTSVMFILLWSKKSAKPSDT